jgi:hypothetical protein
MDNAGAGAATFTVTPAARDAPGARRRWIALLVVSSLLTASVFLHLPGVNGPDYWEWAWQRLDAPRAFAFTALAALPFFAGQYVRSRRPRDLRLALLLVSLSMFLLEIVCAGLYSRPFGLARVPEIIESPLATSYYSVAASLSGGPHARHALEILRAFPDLTPSLPYHATTKPPGPVLFHYALIKLLGVGPPSSLAAGLVIGALAAFGVPLTFLLLRRLLGDAEAAFHGASFYALCPGLILFFPQFDQIYPLFTCALALSWSLALEGRGSLYAVCFGVVLSLATFMSYTLLTLGIFLGGYTLAAAARGWGGCDFARAARRVFVSLLVVALFYAALRLLAGFDPIRTFTTALSNQSVALSVLKRPYPRSVPWDLYDFALGTGWLGFLLASFRVGRQLGGERGGRELCLSLLAVGQILGLAASGLMQTETSRVWLFMTPLLAIPVGAELRRWKFTHQLTTYFCLWLILAAVHQNMVFLNSK